MNRRISERCFLVVLLFGLLLTIASCGKENPALISSTASEKAMYTVTVCDQDGYPVVGATVLFCDDEGCRLPLMTDARGVVTVEYEPSLFHVTITADGYTVAERYDFEEGKTELTAKLTKRS